MQIQQNSDIIINQNYGGRGNPAKVMLDKKTAAVMRAINDICRDGSYKVVSADDLIDMLPKKLSLDKQSLLHTVTFLKEREYISVKFCQSDEYCLSSLPKGRTFVENREERLKEERKSCKRNAVIYFLAAMIGAMVGSCLFWLFFVSLN